jgi:hypothetical protein
LVSLSFRRSKDWTVTKKESFVLETEPLLGIPIMERIFLTQTAFLSFFTWSAREMLRCAMVDMGNAMVVAGIVVAALWMLGRVSTQA